ncbi:MAG: MucR family transcriptional regulator [Alphaproteobacteria bacterium]|nr:MucR family transcriptional regulator [Alphaproteobacteria bacterium]
MSDAASDAPSRAGKRGLTASDRELLPLVADITAAYCAHGRLEANEVPAVIRAVFAALDALGTTRALVPAVTIRASVRPDYLICLEDGRKFKMLRRHLRCVFNLTPAQYRAKWGLSRDYPMVAPNYSMTRSRLAQTWNLGRMRTRRVTADAGPTPAIARR